MATTIHRHSSHNGHTHLVQRKTAVASRRKLPASSKAHRDAVAPEDIAFYNAVSRSAAKSLSR